jgi:hypothetical protein
LHHFGEKQRCAAVPVDGGGNDGGNLEHHGKEKEKELVPPLVIFSAFFVYEFALQFTVCPCSCSMTS